MDSLNAFRAVLVALATLAMFASFALGNVAAGLWLLLAICLHAALWLHLWRTKRGDEQHLGHLDDPVGGV
ncbi:MAG TPA: hypothetical protein VGA36_01935 [Nitriliruptorales bacterium]